MPFITIQTKKSNNKINIEEFGRTLSHNMKISLDRINIIVKYFEEEDVFFGSGNDYIVISIWVSEVNEKEFIDDLFNEVKHLAGNLLNNSFRISVICNIVKEGHLALIH